MLSGKSSVLSYFLKAARFIVICHVITVNQQIDILELKDLEKECVLAQSRLTLAQQDPPSAAIAGNHTYLMCIPSSSYTHDLCVVCLIYCCQKVHPIEVFFNILIHIDCHFRNIY